MEAPEQRKPTADERRAAIADAARALIAERGFEGLRTRDIADRVGINVATLHYHVPTKQALVRLVAQSLRDDFRRQHQRRPRDGLPARGDLLAEFADFRETLEVAPQTFLLLAELGERARRDPEIAAEMAPMKAFWRAQIVSILARGRDDGSFRANLDPEAAATLIIGAMIAARRHDAGDLARFDAICAELLRSVEHPRLAAPSRQDR